MAPIKRKATAPCGSGPRQNEPLKLNPAAKGVAKRRKKSRLANAKRFFPQTGLKRDTIHNVLNSSYDRLKDSPNSKGMYKRRNRRSGRYFTNQISNTSTDDCIILPDKPPVVISLVDTDDEGDNILKRKLPLQDKNEQSPKHKRTRLSNSPKAGPSTSSQNKNGQTENVPFFIDTKKEDAPILQIPLYKPNNDSIICLDDTLPQPPLPVLNASIPKYESVLQDSVIVLLDDSHVENKKGNATLEDGELPPDDSFIPLESGSAPTKRHEKKGPEKRLVILDGNNIAMQHGNNQAFSVQGIKIAIKHFEDMGHEVKAVIPQFRMKLHKSTSQVLMEKLQSEGKLLLTPCKNLPGKVSASYDDRFILEVAEKCDGAIISNDNYKDLLKEKPEWNKIITSRVIGFMFCGDNLFIPTDPYGKHGPKLNTILHKTSEEK